MLKVSYRQYGLCKENGMDLNQNISQREPYNNTAVFGSFFTLLLDNKDNSPKMTWYGQRYQHINFLPESVINYICDRVSPLSWMKDLSCFTEFKIKNGVGKYIHRKAMKGILPDFILENKIKFGFDSPLSEILFNEGENSVKSVLLSDRCLNRGLFDKETLKKMFLESKTNKINTSRYLYRILCVELWFREFID